MCYFNFIISIYWKTWIIRNLMVGIIHDTSKLSRTPPSSECAPNHITSKSIIVWKWRHFERVLLPFKSWYKISETILLKLKTNIVWIYLNQHWANSETGDLYIYKGSQVIKHLFWTQLKVEKALEFFVFLDTRKISSLLKLAIFLVTMLVS